MLPTFNYPLIRLNYQYINVVQNITPVVNQKGPISTCRIIFTIGFGCTIMTMHDKLKYKSEMHFFIFFYHNLL